MIMANYSDVIMGVIASEITSLTVVYSAIYSDAYQRKQQSSASLAFVRTGEFPAQMASNAEKRFHLMTSSCIQQAFLSSKNRYSISQY